MFRTNAQVEQYNNSVYDTCKNHKLIITSLDSVIASVSDDMAHHILSMIPEDARKTMQLPAKMSLVTATATVNVNVSDGLADGAGGVLQKIFSSPLTI